MRGTSEAAGWRRISYRGAVPEACMKEVYEIWSWPVARTVNFTTVIFWLWRIRIKATAGGGQYLADRVLGQR